jgi:hypothetical protein
LTMIGGTMGKSFMLVMAAQIRSWG